MFVAVDGKAAGLIGVADPIKETTPEAIRQLHQDKIQIVMLTGDTRTTAAAVARKLGIDDVIAEVLPEDKNKQIKQLQKQGRFVAMAGDGINDAPALAQAQVGIAGHRNRRRDGERRRDARERRPSRNRARANAEPGDHEKHQREPFLAFVYDALGAPIAAGVLYPFFGLLLNPMIAAAAMSCKFGFGSGERITVTQSTP
jgi:P-type Cu+ transporter